MQRLCHDSVNWDATFVSELLIWASHFGKVFTNSSISVCYKIILLIILTILENLLFNVNSNNRTNLNYQNKEQETVL